MPMIQYPNPIGPILDWFNDAPSPPSPNVPLAPSGAGIWTPDQAIVTPSGTVSQGSQMVPEPPSWLDKLIMGETVTNQQSTLANLGVNPALAAGLAKPQSSFTAWLQANQNTVILVIGGVVILSFLRGR